MCSWKCQQNFLLSPIRRSKPKFLNLKVFIDLARSIPTQFSPFCTWIFYTYKYEYFIRIYQYFSCLHSLHECSVTNNHYLPLPPRINFFSCSSQRRKGINVIYDLTITASFQLNRPGLEFKQTEAIGFFPNFDNNNNERTGQVMWVAEQRKWGWRRRKPVFICLPFLTLNSTHHMHLWKRRETRKRLFPNINRTWNKF